MKEKVSRWCEPGEHTFCCELSRVKHVLARGVGSRRDLSPGLVHALSLVRVDVIVSATTPVNVVCFFFSSSLVSPFSYSGRSVARKQLLATSLLFDNRAPLGAGPSCAPGF
jgi:hypothetical protein